MNRHLSQILSHLKKNIVKTLKIMIEEIPVPLAKE